MTEAETGTSGSIPSARRFLQDEKDRSSLPTVYCNGFEFTVSLSDVCLVTQISGKPEQRLYMSFTTAKALMHGMQQLVADIERVSGQEIPTMDQLNTAFTATDAEG